MSAMKRLGEDMQRDPAQFVNRGDARTGGGRGAEKVHLGFGPVAGQMTHGIDFTREELAAMGAKGMRNFKGEWVTVLPLCWMHGEPVYPPVEVEPGEKKRAAEAAINARYQEYRDAKKKRGAQGGSGRYYQGDE